MVILGGGSVSYEQGTPVAETGKLGRMSSPLTPNPKPLILNLNPHPQPLNPNA